MNKILSIGQELPAVYMDRFNPEFGIPTRISFVKMQCLATETHFLNREELDLKGSYECTGGICCQALPVKSQSYVIPVIFWKNPQAEASQLEGCVKLWSCPRTVWQQLGIMQREYGSTNPNVLIDCDIVVTRTKSGQGSRTNMSFPPGNEALTLKSKLSPEKYQEIVDTVERFYALGEQMLVKPMTESDWVGTLSRMGYDCANHVWLTHQLPMNNYGARQAISQGFGQAYAGPSVPAPQIPSHLVPPAPNTTGYAPPQQAQASAAAPVHQPAFQPPVPPAPTAPPAPPQMPKFQAPPANLGQPMVPPVPPSVAPVNTIAEEQVSTTELEALLDD